MSKNVFASLDARGGWEITANVNGGRAYGWGKTKAAAIAAALRVVSALRDELEAAEYEEAFAATMNESSGRWGDD